MKSRVILIILFPFFCSALVNPKGFININEHITQGGSFKGVLGEYESQQFVISLLKGAVINEGGIVTADGKIFKDTETYHEDQHRLLRGTRDITSENPIFFQGNLAVISSPGQENWYHWLFQVLPRIKILVDSGIKFDKIIINNLRYEWQKESLKIVMEIFNLKETSLFLTKGDCIVQADNLIVPSVPFIPSKSPVFPKWLKKFLRDTFLVEDDATNCFERIYISRSNANIRHVANENDLTAILKKEGFVVIHLEDLSPKNQAMIFNHAKIIIGPHGSGFANLIFSNPNTRIVEIDHGLIGEDQRSFYKRMAKIMDCQYLSYYTDTVDESELENDLTIDLADFKVFCKKNNVF